MENSTGLRDRFLLREGDHAPAKQHSNLQTLWFEAMNRSIVVPSDGQTNGYHMSRTIESSAQESMYFLIHKLVV